MTVDWAVPPKALFAQAGGKYSECRMYGKRGECSECSKDGKSSECSDLVSVVSVVGLVSVVGVVSNYCTFSERASALTTRTPHTPFSAHATPTYHSPPQLPHPTCYTPFAATLPDPHPSHTLPVTHPTRHTPYPSHTPCTSLLSVTHPLHTPHTQPTLTPHTPWMRTDQVGIPICGRRCG